MSSPRVRCEECNQQFNAKVDNEQLETIEVRYIECPHCGKRVLVTIMDDEIQAAVDKVEKLKAKHRASKDDTEEARRWDAVLEQVEQVKKLTAQKKKQYKLTINRVLNND